MNELDVRRSLKLFIVSSFAVFAATQNVTTFLELDASTTNTDSEFNGTWRVLVTNEARGFPVRKGNIGISNVWAGQPCCESWSRDGWTKLSKEEALQQNPPLEVDTLQLADSIPMATLSKDAHQYKQGTDGVWRGTMARNSRVRLNFTPPESGRAALAIYLCEFEEINDDWCVSIVMTGSSPNGKSLRYQTKRHLNSTSDEPKSYIVRQDYKVEEGWLGNGTYHFQIERGTQGDLEVQLDKGDPMQRRQMNIPSYSTYDKIAVSLLATLSDTARELQIKADSSWQGNLPVGENIQVSFSPTSRGTGHLGLALCRDRFRVDCKATIIDGLAGGKLVRNEPAFWTAGSQKADEPMSDSSKNARWANHTFTFILSRTNDSSVTIFVDEGQGVWSVPANYQFLVVDSYQEEGNVKVNYVTENIAASVWKLNIETGELRSPPIPKRYVQNSVCVSVAARLSEDANLTVSVQRYDTNHGEDLDTLSSASDSQWVKKRLVIKPSPILQNNTVQIVLTAKQPAQTKSPILVQWVAGCDPNRYRDEVSVKGFVTPLILKDQIGFRSNQRRDNSTISEMDFLPKAHRVCQNDGYIHIDGKCLCRPGFSGKMCQKPCGPNRFGEFCEERCSDGLPSSECRGMFFCTEDLPCDCGPGFRGPRCDQLCEYGTYGVGCRQKCGQCANGNSCDRYTGMCSTGCKGSQLPPLCKDVCGKSEVILGLIGDGGLARQVEYPWHAGIYKKDFTWHTSDGTTTLGAICGGTLIRPNIVISAAHCFWNVDKKVPPTKFLVGLAKTKSFLNSTEEFPHRVQIRRLNAIHVPPGFIGFQKSTGNDIALLELTSPVDITDFVIPACFDYIGGYEGELTTDSVGRVPGWGLTRKNVPNEDLREGKISYILPDECIRNSLNTAILRYITKDRFCAGQEYGAYVGKGDSGGGIVFQQSGVWFLRGVLSAGGPNTKVFALYTNVSYYRDWIVSEMYKIDLRKALIGAFFS